MKEIFSTIEEAIAAIKRGEFIVVVDDEDRENEGDLIIAAEHMTQEKMSFLLQYTSGVVCVPMQEERLQQLQLPLMVYENTESQRTAFTISVDAKDGTTTGISAADRSVTIRALANPLSVASDFRRPGHIFPLQGRKGGVLKRAGHTEAALDLMQLAALSPVGVLCEIVNPDNSMARLDTLVAFAKQHQLPLISIADLIRYRRKSEKLVTMISEAYLPTEFGTFLAIVYQSHLDEVQHMVLMMGDVKESPPLVRVHSECLTGDIFSSKRCDCGEQLHCALREIAKEGRGILVYLRGQEGRGIGLGHKIRAYSLQDEGFDTVEANEALGLPIDSREYGIGAQILADLGVTSMRLLTNNPSKYGGLEGYGIEIIERVSMRPTFTKENLHYLRTKAKKMGHLIDVS